MIDLIKDVFYSRISFPPGTEKRCSPVSLPDQPLPYFRCYLLNAANSITSVDGVDADDDEAALAAAKSLLNSKHNGYAAVEVWFQKRLVGKILSEIAHPTKLESLVAIKKKPE